MPAVDAHPSRTTILSALCVIIVGLCAVTLAGCKKDQDQTETGDVHSSPVSVIEGAGEIAAQESLPPLPSPDMKGLSVDITTQKQTTPAALPDMVPVPGMDMSVRISARMKNTPGWTPSFANLLPVIMNCLMKVDNGAAYVTHITDHDNHAPGIEISGLDDRHFYCQIAQNGTPSIAATQSGGDHASSALFFPRQAGAPVLDQPECYEIEPVVARPNGLIGWLAFPSSTSCAGATR